MNREINYNNKTKNNLDKNTDIKEKKEIYKQKVDKIIPTKCLQCKIFQQGNCKKYGLY